MVLFTLCVEDRLLFSSLFFLLQVNFFWHESKGFLGSRTLNNQCIILGISFRHIQSIIYMVQWPWILQLVGDKYWWMTYICSKGWSAHYRWPVKKEVVMEVYENVWEKFFLIWPQKKYFGYKYFWPFNSLLGF